MSTNSIAAATSRWGLTRAASCACRGSGTGTAPALGSMVQKGKFSAAMPALVRALNRVDLPTLGKPMMPHLKPMAPILSRYSRRQARRVPARAPARAPVQAPVQTPAKAPARRSHKPRASPNQPALCNWRVAAARSPRRYRGSAAKAAAIAASINSPSAAGARAST